MIGNKPIGLFDSGLGGITIWKEIHKLLPNESTIYLADSKNAPYGTKSQDEIIALCIKNASYLISKNVKIIVVACNTATTNAIKELRARFDIPFIGVEPAIKPAVNSTKTKHIGVLATAGTMLSEKYKSQTLQYPDINFVEQMGTGLVQLIENGQLHSKEMDKLLNQYMENLLLYPIDTIVLGCTHYPLFKNKLKNILPKDIHIIDSGKAIANRVFQVLSENHWGSTNPMPSFEFFTNGNSTILQELIGKNYIATYQNF